MVGDVMVATAFVVVSVAVLACFALKFILVKKPPQVAPHTVCLYSRLRQGPIEIQDRGHTPKARKSGCTVGFNRRTI